jgi:hypothetical protein
MSDVLDSRTGTDYCWPLITCHVLTFWVFPTLQALGSHPPLVQATPCRLALRASVKPHPLALAAPQHQVLARLPPLPPLDKAGLQALGRLPTWGAALEHLLIRARLALRLQRTRVGALVPLASPGEDLMPAPKLPRASGACGAATVVEGSPPQPIHLTALCGKCGSNLICVLISL